MKFFGKAKVLAFMAAAALVFAACGGDGESSGGSKGTVTSVTIAPANASVAVGETITLTATPNATPAKASYSWTVSNTSYASLNNTSDATVITSANTVTVKGLAVGSVTVTATVDGVSSSPLTVTVTAAPVTTPTLQSVTISGNTDIAATATANLEANPTFNTNPTSDTTAYSWAISQVDGVSASSTNYATLTFNGKTANLQANNTTTASHTVKVTVTATYNGKSVTATKTVTIAAAGQAVENKLTDLTLVAEANTIKPAANTILTAAATYSGTVSLNYEWKIIKVDGESVTTTNYASLTSGSEGRDSRSAVTVSKYNTLANTNTTASDHTITVQLTVTNAADSTNAITKEATVTVSGAKVTGIAIAAGKEILDSDGQTSLSATVTKTADSVEYVLDWKITSEDGTSVTESSYATLTKNADGTASLTGKNTTAAKHTLVVTATATNKNDSTNVESTSKTIIIEKTGVSTAYFPVNTETEAYADTYLEITFDSAPVINRASSGTVRIYKSDDTLVDTIKPAAETMYGYGYSGNSGLGYINVQYQLIQAIGNTVRIILHHNTTTGQTLLENATSYYVLVDNGLITGKIKSEDFAGITDKSKWTFKTKAEVSVSNNTITVGKDKNFITIQGALSYLMSKSKTGDWTLKIDTGTYYERLFYKGNASITMIGQGDAVYGTDTRIEWCNQDGGQGTSLWNYGSRGRNVFYYAGKNLVLEKLSIVNTATRKTNAYGEPDASGTDTASGSNQAEALMFDSTGTCAAWKCTFTSKQDTLYLSPSGGKAWFYGCKISGDVDFIWGGSTAALFENCEIEALLSEKTAYITETRVGKVGASTVGKGFVFLYSTIKGDGGSNATYLSRLASQNAKASPSKTAYDQVAFINSTFDSSAKVSSYLWLATDAKYPRFIAKDTNGNVNVGWKTYGYTGISPVTTEYAGEMTAALYSMEYNGRYAILNRLYNTDYSAYQTESAKWDLTSLETAFAATADASKNNAFTEPDTSTSTTIKWDFTAIASGTTYEGKTGTFAATAGKGTLYVDATNGKLSTRGSDAQFNSGTKAYIPASAGDKISVTLYSNTYILGGTTATKETTEITVAAGDLTTYEGVSCVALTATGNTYLYLISLVPANGDGSSGSVTEDSWTLTSRSDAPFSGIGTSAAAIASDAVVAGSKAILNLTLTSSGTKIGASKNTPSYKYDSSKGLCIKYDALKITGVTGNVLLTLKGRNNGGSARNLEVTLSDSSSVVDTYALASSTDFTYTKSFTANNTTIYIGASNETFINTITIAKDTTELSSVTISGGTSVTVGKTLTLTAKPNVSTTGAYTWTVTNGTGTVTYTSSTTNTITLTGATVGIVTVKASVDGVFSTDYTVTVRDAGSTPKISLSDVPTGWASYTGAPTTWGGAGGTVYDNVDTYDKLVSALKASASSRIIYITGEIDLCNGKTGYDFIKEAGYESNYTDYSDYQTKFGASCTDGRASTLASVQSDCSDKQKATMQMTIPSNTSIIGKTANAGVKNGVLSISNATNVVIRNLTIKDAYDYFPSWYQSSENNFNAEWDNVVITGSTHVWVDHCTIGDSSHTYAKISVNNNSRTENWVTYDGLLDVVNGSNYVTLSYNKFENHDKTTLIGNSDGKTADDGKLKVTLHHNYYNGCTQRLPRVRSGQVHLFNNYYESIGSYCIGVGTKSQVYSEKNYFSSTAKKAYEKYTKEGYADGCLTAVDNFDATNTSTTSYSSADWTPSTKYTYEAAAADDNLVSDVKSNAGAGVWEVEQ